MASTMLKSAVTIVAAVLSVAVLAIAQSSSSASAQVPSDGVHIVPTTLVLVVGMILSFFACICSAVQVCGGSSKVGVAAVTSLGGNSKSKNLKYS